MARVSKHRRETLHTTPGPTYDLGVLWSRAGLSRRPMRFRNHFSKHKETSALSSKCQGLVHPLEWGADDASSGSGGWGSLGLVYMRCERVFMCVLCM